MLHNTSFSDRDLRNYTLSDTKWNYLQKIHEFLKHFKKATDFISGQSYPTLAFSVPVYNFLLNKIEDEIESNTIFKIKEATKAVDRYVYIISTNKLNYKLNYKLLIYYLITIYN